MTQRLNREEKITMSLNRKIGERSISIHAGRIANPQVPLLHLHPLVDHRTDEACLDAVPGLNGCLDAVVKSR